MRLLFIVITLCLLTGCGHIRVLENDSWLGRDKAYHFGAGAVIGGGTALLAAQANDRETSLAFGFSSAMLAGAGKEWYDHEIKKTGVSWKDFAWTCIGASVGVSLAGLATD